MPTITAERGLPAALGATIHEDGVEFAVVSQAADEILVCLFDVAGERETTRLALPGRDGDIRFGFVPGLGPGARYGLRARGPFDPANLHRFDAEKLLVDPYAAQLDRPFAFHRELCLPPDRAVDTGALVPKAIVVAPTLAGPPLPPGPSGFTYEVLVKGFTMRHPQVPERLRGTLAALAEPAILDHLARLGVETVELMPVAAAIDERHLAPLGLRNAWGYNSAVHMALDPRLAPNGFADLRCVTDAMHARGIRVLLDVVFNHSGESDLEGPTISYRGLDNRLYYDHHPDGSLVNVTGCGNTLALYREPVARMVKDGLRRFATLGGVDGFRYDLGPVLGRDPEGFDPHAPLLREIAGDDVLKPLAHVAEPWDIGPGGYRVGAFPPPWREWQDRYRDDVRRFWRGDGCMAGALATRIAGSADLFQTSGRRPSDGVNFVAAHDGFALADIVAYAQKHNEANGEENRDGHNDNHSWNHGVEGETTEEPILEARARDVRALLATLFFSRGTPLITAGDEFGRTQGGNNNAYAQDNETVWLDWDRADGPLLAFAARLADLRRRHAALSSDRFLAGATPEGVEHPDVVWLTEGGAEMTPHDWNDWERRFMAVLLDAPEAAGKAEAGRVLIAFNAGWDARFLWIPAARKGRVWRLAVRSDEPLIHGETVHPEEPLCVAPRAVYLLAER